MNIPPFPYHLLVKVSDVGPERTGVIYVDLRPMFDTFHIIEDGDTGYRFSVVRKFTDPIIWNALSLGTRVKFRATIRLPRIVEITII